MTHLILHGISKFYGGTAVLPGLDLVIKKGEFVTLLGPSGCGKTTTIRIIAGLTPPDSGKLLLNGVDISALPPERRPFNTVFQSYALFPNMNVKGNVAYGLKAKKVARAEIDQKVTDILKLVQLSGMEHRRPDELSGGQRQRVAIARALVLSPEILLLDEPLGALDLKLRREMQQELKAMQRSLGITFIYITHDQEEALNMSDRIAVMNAGRIMQFDTPGEIFDRPKNRFVAEFIGQTNLISHGGQLISIRPDDVMISKTLPDNLPNAAGVISEMQYIGGAYRVTVDSNSAGRVTACIRRRELELTAGDNVFIYWHPDTAWEIPEGTA